MGLKPEMRIGSYTFYFETMEQLDFFRSRIDTYFKQNPTGVQDFTGFYKYEPFEFILQSYFGLVSKDAYHITDFKTGSEYRCPEEVLLIGGQLLKRPKDRQS